MNKIFLIFLLFISIIVSNKVDAACAAPPAPINGAISNSSCTGFTLSWQNGGGSTTHFYVYVCTSQWAGCLAGTAPTLYTTGTTSRNIAGVTPGVTYYWRVRAYNSANGGCFGGEISGSFTVPACCSDGVMNNGEAGVDCGGSCAPCGGASCFDGILNQNEIGIDCGGVCPACIVSCNDGIQNGAETGVDCGGACGIACNQNTGTTSGTTACTGAELATIYSTNCDQVGTSAYNTNTPTINAVSSGAYTAPPNAAGCGSYGGTGIWARYELDSDVNTLLVSFQSGSMGAGNSITYVAAYNTNSACPVAGDFVGCNEATEFNSGLYYAYNTQFDGLDPNKDVWLFFYNDNNKAFNLNYDLIGVANADIPANQSCATSSAALDEGCNLAATGASFATPGASGVACGGGNWGSNENTVFYSFTADDVIGSLEIDNISCNDGTAGNGQFGVWTSCAAIGTYGAGFLGCQVGVAPLSLNPLTPGQTYYIAMDGFAGDNCTWNFTGTGIVMPVTYSFFGAEHLGEEVRLDWSVESQTNNDYFTVQRTSDGISYEDIGIVDGAGTIIRKMDYAYVDENPLNGVSYYRIKQTDFDGNFKYTNIVSVSDNSKNKGLLLVPNPADEMLSLNFYNRSQLTSRIKIINYSGVVVYEETFEVNKGNVSKLLDISQIESGLYNVILTTGNEVLTNRFSIK
ncbi:MAG: T9SS type A sorting domain-containing protein [Flavobacteriia bacterium]|nr:T9SS type A sorting domain-containing protein [Flavobacteriia bacterium]